VILVHYKIVVAFVLCGFSLLEPAFVMWCSEHKLYTRFV